MEAWCQQWKEQSDQRYVSCCEGNSSESYVVETFSRLNNSSRWYDPLDQWIDYSINRFIHHLSIELINNLLKNLSSPLTDKAARLFHSPLVRTWVAKHGFSPTLHWLQIKPILKISHFIQIIELFSICTRFLILLESDITTNHHEDDFISCFLNIHTEWFFILLVHQYHSLMLN